MLFWRRRPINPGPVMLLEPADGAVTTPLQQFGLPPEETPPADGSAEAADSPSPAWWNPQLLSPDRSHPQPVIFRWLPPPGIRRALRYDLLIGSEPELVSPIVIRDIPQPSARVRHLFVDSDYYWKVFATTGGEMISGSRVNYFRTHPSLPRWIHAPHITNMRDLGGWPVPGGLRVRQGMLYRSSEMNGHLSLSADGMHVLLGELALRTDLDMRGVEENPSPALPEEYVRHVNIPVLPYDQILLPEMLEAYARIFALLSQEEHYPMVMHCWAGADRAATASFIVHAALGVQLRELEADYELSSLSVWGPRLRNGAGMQALKAALAGFAETPTDSINTQVTNYLRVAGVAADRLAQVRELLLEKAPAAPRQSQPW